jgi:hypothetical protein
MVSVASKGYVVSYSINRPTFIFNIMCFVTGMDTNNSFILLHRTILTPCSIDVFSIFTICSWLFYDNGYHNHYHVFYFKDQQVDIFTAIWYVRISMRLLYTITPSINQLFVCIFVIIGYTKSLYYVVYGHYLVLVLLFVWLLKNSNQVPMLLQSTQSPHFLHSMSGDVCVHVRIYRSWRKRCRNYCFFLFFLVPFCCMLFGPFMIAMEGLKFSIFPLGMHTIHHPPSSCDIAINTNNLT